MFVQINPDVESYSETISTLKFAERVSGVELGAARSNKEGRYVRELMDQVPTTRHSLLYFFKFSSTVLFLFNCTNFSLNLDSNSVHGVHNYMRCAIF